MCSLSRNPSFFNKTVVYRVFAATLVSNFSHSDSKVSFQSLSGSST